MEEEQKRLIEEALEETIDRYPVDVALGAIREVYGGKLWIVGGFISSLAIPLMHGYNVSHHTDLDIFLAESVDFDKINMPKEWIRNKTVFGSPRFVKGSDQVDISCLSNIRVIRERGLDIVLESYLRTVPLTTQSLAYDVEEGKVYDDIGLHALETGTVRVNDIEELRSKRSARDYLVKKADKLGFAPIIDF